MIFIKFFRIPWDFQVFQVYSHFSRFSRFSRSSGNPGRGRGIWGIWGRVYPPLKRDMGPEIPGTPRKNMGPEIPYPLERTWVGYSGRVRYPRESRVSRGWGRVYPPQKGTWDQRYPTPEKEHGTRDTLPPGKDMGPETRKGPGTRDTLPPLHPGHTDTRESITLNITLLCWQAVINTVQ